MLLRKPHSTLSAALLIVPYRLNHRSKTPAQERCRKGLLKALLLIAALFFVSCNRSAEVGLNPGDLAPEVALTDIDGKPQKLSDFRGKIVLLNFWASWCTPCIAEMPSLQRLQQKLESKGFSVVTVAVDDEVETLKKFRRRFGLSFPILLDVKGESKKEYKISGYPETFILNRKGQMVLFSDPENGMPSVRIVGPRRWDEPNAIVRIEKLLGEKEKA